MAHRYFHPESRTERMIVAIFLVVVAFLTVNSIPLEKLCKDRSVIAFGDSLTHGLFVSADPMNRRGEHPYSIALQSLMRNMSVVVEERGINGEKAAELMYKLPPLLKEKRADPIFVIILAGTNDLAYKLSHNSIVWHLKKMHNAVQLHALHIKRNIYTIAMSIPELKWGVKDSDRLAVNRDMEEYARRCNSSVAYLDLNEKFNQSVPENTKFWSTDNVHFSKVGYDKIGHMLFKKMEDFALTKTEASLTTLDFSAVCV